MGFSGFGRAVLPLKGNTLRAGLLRLLCAALLLCLCAGLLWLRGRGTPNAGDYEITVFPPTCTGQGYSVYTHREIGESFVSDRVAALGHSFGPWQSLSEPTLAQAGQDVRRCDRCGGEETRLCFAELPLPVLAIEGSLEGIGKKQEVPIQLRLTGDTPISCSGYLKHQGHSTLRYDKKNYTLKLRTAEDEKYKVSLSHWNPESKYILKADALDPTLCRNLVCANVWAAVTADRDPLGKELKDLSNYGAVDGFPVALYINGSFSGLYNWNLHKDDDLFAMSEGKSHAILICNEPEGASACFREEADFSGDCPWEVEFCGTQDSAWAREKFNALIRFVNESDDALFRRDLEKYLDVAAAMDYLLTVYALGLTNHGTDELVLACWSEGGPFVPSLYDLETGFGLSPDGTGFRDPDSFLPFKVGESWDSATGNLLWDRLLQNFYPQLCARYAQLRQQILEPENLCARVNAFTGSIPQALYEANQIFHPGLPEAREATDQILSYIQARIPLVDKLFQYK